MLAALLLAVSPALLADELYEADVAFALDALEETCGHFFEQKEIDWQAVRAEFTAGAEAVGGPEDHRVLLTRLLARLEDGHAEVVPLEKGKDVGWPAELVQRWESETGPGMFLCRSGKKIYVKSAWNAARALGIEPGMEVVEVDGVAAARWLESRVAVLSDFISFSTPQHALFHACHYGLAMPSGTRLELELKTVKGKKTQRTLTYGRASAAPWGPAFPPEEAEALDDDVLVGTSEEGFGYVHLRRMRGDVVERIDEALARLEDPPGLILDFRANAGGAFDHDAMLGRFVPAGRELERADASPIPSAGPTPYGGPIVVIVDGGVRSAGETGAGMFKEDGRAYMIGESATAGMSSQKTTIELPSRLFGLYVSIASNKGRFNDGRGIEGIGVVPHEIVEYDPKDLAEGIDTLIRRAEELLDRFPKDAVPYDPKAHGWRPKR